MRPRATKDAGWGVEVDTLAGSCGEGGAVEHEGQAVVAAVDGDVVDGGAEVVGWKLRSLTPRLVVDSALGCETELHQG